MANAIVLTVLVLIVGSACRYIYKQKKKGVKCIGCPNACNCSRSSCGGNQH